MDYQRALLKAKDAIHEASSVLDRVYEALSEEIGEDNEGTPQQQQMKEALGDLIDKADAVIAKIEQHIEE